MALMSILHEHCSIKSFNIAYNNRFYPAPLHIPTLRLLFNNGKYFVVKIVDMMPRLGKTAAPVCCRFIQKPAR